MDTQQMKKIFIGQAYEREKVLKRKIETNKLEVYSGHKTAAKISEKFHISPGTAQKYYKFYRCVESIRKKSPKSVKAIFSNEYKISHNRIVELSAMSAKEIEENIKNYRKSCKSTFRIDVYSFISVIESWIYMLDLYDSQIDVATAEKKKIEDALNLLITKCKLLISNIGITEEKFYEI